MDRIYQMAMFCVGRAVMFSALAISLVTFSLAFDPALALKAGGILALLLSAILLWFAQTAHRRKPRDTETWLLLKNDARPAGDQGARLFASVMEEVYLYFAVRVFAVAIALTAGSFLLAALGVESVFA